LVVFDDQMTIILSELSYSSQATESTRSLVSVQGTEVGETHGKFTVTTLTVVENEEVGRAVHGLEGPLALLDIKLKHIVLVVLPVTGSLPDINIVHVGGLNLLVATLAVFGAKQRLDLVVDLHSIWEHESTTRGRIIKEEEFLRATDFEMVSEICLLQL
jgi:hypothetical protein